MGRGCEDISLEPQAAQTREVVDGGGVLEKFLINVCIFDEMKREKKKKEGKRRCDCNEMKSNGVVFFTYLFICLFIYFADAHLPALDFI